MGCRNKDLGQDVLHLAGGVHLNKRIARKQLKLFVATDSFSYRLWCQTWNSNIGCLVKRRCPPPRRWSPSAKKEQNHLSEHSHLQRRYMQRLYQISNLSQIRRKIFIQLRKYFLDFSIIRNNFAIKVIKARIISIKVRGTCNKVRETYDKVRETYDKVRGTCNKVRGTCNKVRGTCNKVRGTCNKVVNC